jgi:hypothetical protein
MDPVEDPNDPALEDPDVIVGGEFDVRNPRAPQSMWFHADGQGGFRADGPLHDAQLDSSGYVWIGGHYRNGTVCSSPLGVRTSAVSIGRTALAGDVHSVGVNTTGDLYLSRGSFIEKYTNNLFGVQQSWMFPFRPTTSGDLVVRVDVAGQEFVGAFPLGLHFAPAGDFGTTYGNATWIDGNGVETAIPSRFENGQIVLRVPSAVVASSKFPAVLDPQIDRNETPVDSPVNNAPTGANAIQPAVASSGVDYLAVWRDDRNGTDSDIFGMVISSTGGLSTQNGVLISKTAAGARAPGVQSNPTVAFVNGSYLVVWQDFKSPAADSDLVAARVSTAGVATLIGPIATSGATEARPRIAVRGTEALVAFESGSGVQAIRYNGTSFVGGAFPVAAVGSEPSVSANPAGDYLVAYTDDASTNLFGQFVTSGGALNGPAITIAGGTGAQELSAGSFAGGNHIVVWQNNSGGRKLFGARVTPAGAVLDTHVEATLTANGVQLGTSASLVAGASPGLVCSATTCAATWSDRRNFNTLGTGNDVFALPFAPDMTVTTANEIALSTETQDQRNPALAFATATNRLLVMWDDLRNGTPSQITGTRVNISGAGAAATLTMLDAAALRITASVGVNSELTSVVARIINGANWLIAWGDSRGTTGNNIQGTLVSDSLAIAPLGNTISNAPGHQGSPAVAVTTSQHLVVWSDARNGVEDIFGARVTSNGTVQDLTGLTISSFAKEQLRPQIASNGSNRYLVVWQDRGHGADFDIYGAILDTSGAVLVSEIPISTSTGDQALPAVAFDSVAGQFLVVWQDARAGGANRDIFGARVNTDGTVVDAAGVSISSSAGGQFNPRITFGTNRFFVVWEDRRTGVDIFGTRVQISGGNLTVQDPNGIAISTAVGGQQRPSVAFVASNEFAPAGTQTGVGAFAVVWDDGRTNSSTNLDIFGNVVFQENGNVGDEFAIATSTDNERAPEIGPAGPPQANGSLRMLVTYQRNNSALNAQRVVMRRVTFAAKSINCTTSSCNNNCNTGENCDVNCAQADNCTTVCSTSTCFINCTGATACSTNCINSSNCFTDCRGTDACHVTCATVPQNDSPNFCEVDCSDPNTLDCTDIQCTGNNPNTRAQCVLRCPPGAPSTQCSFGTCGGGVAPTACTTGGVPNGVFACHTTTIDTQGTPCLN